MKTQGYDSVLESFISENDDDPDAMKNAQKRIEFGRYWCTPTEWKFLYGRIEDDVRTSKFYSSSLTSIHADYRELCQWKTYIWVL